MKRCVALVLWVVLSLDILAEESTWLSRWTVESESSEYSIVEIGGDTLEIVAPLGLTLWDNQPITCDTTIEYYAMCVVDSGAHDRLSDMNLFFMASEVDGGSSLVNIETRQGVFKRCSSMQLYYLGYGGNHNRTTRFRRYNTQPSPAIITEYTDSEHLLVANHWYHVKVVFSSPRLQIYVDDRLVVDYSDPEPLKEGYWGFRTTHARYRLLYKR